MTQGVKLNGITDELMTFIREESRNRGFQLIDVVTKGKGSFFIEVTLDKDGGITVGECGRFNRDVSSWIEQKGLFNGKFTLDVCSPGMDRTLKKDTDFAWAVGKTVKIVTDEDDEGRTEFVGKLLKYDKNGSGIVLESEGSKIDIRTESIRNARVWAEV